MQPPAPNKGKVDATQRTSLPCWNGGSLHLRARADMCVSHFFALLFCSSHRLLWTHNPHPRQTGSYICQTHYMGTRVPAERDTCSIPDFQPCPTLQLPSSPSTDKLLRCGSHRGGMRTQDCRFGDCDRLWDDFTPPTDRL